MNCRFGRTSIGRLPFRHINPGGDRRLSHAAAVVEKVTKAALKKRAAYSRARFACAGTGSLTWPDAT